MSDAKLSNVNSYYPVVIVGGGIVGAGIFRDLSLNNIPSLLIDKKDFSSQTSSKSSKILHGGIRYLEQFEFEVIRDCSIEKNLWSKLAPHLCFETRFHFPIYKKNKINPLKMRMGLLMYDFLSGWENTTHAYINKNNLLEKFPQIQEQGLMGAGVYSDVIMDDCKMNLEIIYDALKFKDCAALNYVELVQLEKSEN